MAVLLSPSAVGRDYFVSDRGNDGNAGTRSMPWRTVGKASLTPLEPGDRVLFRGGRTFRGNLFVRARRESGIQPIVIGTYENGRAIIHAGDSTAISILDTGGVIVRNLILRGSGAKSNVGTGLEILNTACVDSKLPDVTVENVEASGFRWAGIYVGGPLREGQRCGSAGQAGFRHIRIIRCVTHHNIYYGIHVGGRWDPKPRSYANQDLVIADSIAHHNEGDPHNFKFHSGSGILVEDTAGAIIERCTAYANGARCASRSGGPVGIWAHNATRVMIRFCVSYRNRTGGAADGGGFDFDGGVSNSVMQRNRSYGNDGPGYMIWNYAHANRPVECNVIRFNSSEDDARRHSYGAVHVGTEGEPLRRIEVHDNRIVMRPALRGRPSLISVRGGQNQALRFYRNLLVLRGRGPLVDTRGDRDAVRYEGNTYCGDSGCFLVIDGHKVYRSPTEWRAQTGRELLPNCMGPPAAIDLSLRPTRGDRPGTCWEVGTNADE